MTRLAPLGLVAILALVMVVPSQGWVDLAPADRTRAEAFSAQLEALPDAPTILVAFDADLGTYAEIRPTVRALLADLLARDGRLAFLSLTPEGRALAIAEQERLRRGEANLARLIDLGFIPGAEGALVQLTRRLETEADGPIARILEADGLAGLDAALVIGGNDLGPRSWVEQVRPRVPDLPLLAVSPTILLPELVPYLVSGQLAALLTTPADGAAYRDGLVLGRLDRLAADRAPDALALLIGLLLGAAVIGQAIGARILTGLRPSRRSETP